MKKLSHAFFIIFIGLLCPACSYTLKLNGTSIPDKMKTIRVDFFENNAALVVNTLSTSFTEALKDRIRNTSRLSIVRGEADAVISGSITDYTIAPSSVPATNNNVAPIANASTLTITVRVKYTSDLDKIHAFDQSFSKSRPYQGDINTQESALITAITKDLTEDIFNKAFSNW
jgi:hypothetical protein